MTSVIGIDLGTTFSAAASVGPEGKPRALPVRNGMRRIPSVVVFDGPSPTVGTRLRRLSANPLQMIQFVKSAMGDPTWRYRMANGCVLRADEVAALILKRLKAEAEAALGRPVTDAVITVPASYDDTARYATVTAAAIAGLTIRTVLDDSTATALACGMDCSVKGTVLICDLGGGTFDASVVRMGPAGSETLSARGDRYLGGIDWDNRLMVLLNRRFQAAGGPDLLRAAGTELQLRATAEAVKRSLTVVQRTHAVLDADGLSQTVDITRAEFERQTAGLVQRTLEIATLAVHDAGLGWSEVDRLVLTGGSTCMPMVRRVLARALDRPADQVSGPSEAVVRGAAIQADLIENGATVTRFQEVVTQGLGLLALDPNGIRRNVVLIPAGTKIPAVGRAMLGTIEDGQTRLHLQLTQGNATDPEQVRRLARLTVELRARHADAPVEIACTYERDRSIVVAIRDATDGTQLGTFAIRPIAATA